MILVNETFQNIFKAPSNVLVDSSIMSFPYNMYTVHIAHIYQRTSVYTTVPIIYTPVRESAVVSLLSPTTQTPDAVPSQKLLSLVCTSDSVRPILQPAEIYQTMSG